MEFKKAQPSALLGLARDIEIAKSKDPNLIAQHLRRFWVDQFDPNTKTDQALELRKLIQDQFVRSKEIYLKIERGMKFIGEVKPDPKDFKNPIVASIMMAGFHSGAFVSAQLENQQIPHDVVLIGCTLRSAEKNIFRTGEHLEPKVHIPLPDFRFLLENSGRQVLLVDDVVESGETVRMVSGALNALGFSEIDAKIVPTLYRF